MIIVFELIFFLVKVIFFWKESAVREDLIMDSYHFEQDFELQEIGTGFQGTLIFFFHCL